MSELLARFTTALAHRYRIERELGAGGMATVPVALLVLCTVAPMRALLAQCPDGSDKPSTPASHQFIACHSPFMAPLRGTPQFERILAKAERRVKEFQA